MPVLTIVAGPNGAGKSTHSKDLTAHRGIEAFDFDKEFYAIWKQFQFDPVIEQGAFNRTGEVYEEKKLDALKSDKNFAFETNFHTNEILDVIKPFRDNGYEIELIFIFLESSEKAIDRVNDRMSKGGHAVSDETVRERFRLGLEGLNDRFQLFDYILLYHSKDNFLEPMAELDISSKKVIAYSPIPELLQTKLPDLQKFINDNSFPSPKTSSVTSL